MATYYIPLDVSISGDMIVTILHLDIDNGAGVFLLFFYVITQLEFLLFGVENLTK